MLKKNEIKETLIHFTLPTYNEIPDVGLYLEQVAKYINTYFQDFPEMCVTTSMISNYVKQKLVARVSKKTYSRDQIACLIFIAMAKTVLSMEDIRIIMATNEEETHEKAYNWFLNLMHETLSSVANAKSAPVKAYSEDNKTMLQNLSIAIAHKMYLERYFALKKLEQQDQKKKEKEEAKK